MNKEKAQELLNSNGDIKQFLNSAPLNFSLLENVETAYGGWNVAERKLPNRKRLTSFLDYSPYIIFITTPILVYYDEICPIYIDDGSQKIFKVDNINLGMTLQYDISKSYEETKNIITLNYDVFNYYLNTKSQTLPMRVINTLTYVRDKYGDTIDKEKYSELMFKILDLKRYYNIKMDFKDMIWEMNI